LSDQFKLLLLQQGFFKTDISKDIKNGSEPSELTQTEFLFARRVDYRPNVKGLDFAVDGLGQFKNITHGETKNAVGSAI